MGIAENSMVPESKPNPLDEIATQEEQKRWLASTATLVSPPARVWPEHGDERYEGRLTELIGGAAPFLRYRFAEFQKGAEHR